MVASTSAFIATTCLPCSNASSATRRAELDRARDVDDDVDAARSGRARTTSSAIAHGSGLDRVLERDLRLVVDDGDRRHARVVESASRRARGRRA